MGDYIKKSNIGLFSLVMIAIVSVDSLRNLPVAAQYGFSLVTFYIVAGLLFFFPLAWITSKLATQYPNTGGSYIWISQAFGSSYGYLSIMLQWLYNIIWYPTIFAFITATIASLIAPDMESNKWFILLVNLGLFWFITFLHCRGLRTSSWISVIGAMVGTLFPMIMIILMAVYWLASGKPSVTPMHMVNLWPTSDQLRNIGFFSNILFSLLGLEIIAMHAGNVRNPSKTYPRATIISAIIILVTLTCSSLACCIIMPVKDISLVSGLSNVLQMFFSSVPVYNLSFIIRICIIIGGIGISAAWMIGLARGLHVSVCAMQAPAFLQRLNKNDVPSGILFLQAIVYTLLMCAFLIFPDINSSYWLLSVITAQFALVYYVLVFFAACKLLQQKDQQPVNKILSLLLPGIGATICVMGILVGFVPPDSIYTSSQIKFQLLFVAIFVSIAIFMLIRLRAGSQKTVG